MAVRLKLAVLAAALPLIVATGSIPAAQAETRTTKDAVGEGRGDIAKVRVTHAPRAVVVRVVGAAKSGLADYYDVWVDTNARNKGPEFLVSYAYETGGASVQRADRFGYAHVGRKVCDLGQGEEIRNGIRLVVPRRCLRTKGNTPQRVRVSVETSFEEGSGDWAPGVRKFGRWVKSS